MWPTKPLGELVQDGELPYGVVQPGFQTPTGVPMIRVKDLRNGRVDQSEPLRVAHEVSARHRRTVLQGGELLLSIVGTIGEAAVAPRSVAGWNVARAIAVIRPVDVSADWIRISLQTADVRNKLTAALNTTVQATLNLADLRRLEIPVPPEPQRRGITEVLAALDDKIAANAKLVAAADSLSAMHFDRMLTLPDSRPLSSLAKFVNGKAFTKDATGTGRVVIRIAELNSGLGGSTVYNDIEVPDDHLARPGDLLFAWSGSLTIHRWYRTEGIVNQHIFKVIPTDVPLWVVKGALDRKLAEFKGIAADKATTMGHIQRRHLDEPVQVPTREEIARNDLSMTALWERSLSAEQESLHLGTVRDALLPQLMSGNIRVKDAERVVEGGV